MLFNYGWIGECVVNLLMLMYWDMFVCVVVFVEVVWFKCMFVMSVFVELLDLIMLEMIVGVWCVCCEVVLVCYEYLFVDLCVFGGVSFVVLFVVVWEMVVFECV